MNEVQFFKIDDCPQTRAEIIAVIAAIDAIINELLTTALRSVANGDVAEYDIETGQTTQRVKYTNPKTVLASIEGYKRLRQMYRNELTPRKVRLMDSGNFRKRF